MLLFNRQKSFDISSSDDNSELGVRVAGVRGCSGELQHLQAWKKDSGRHVGPTVVVGETMEAEASLERVVGEDSWARARARELAGEFSGDNWCRWRPPSSLESGGDGGKRGRRRRNGRSYWKIVF